MNCHECREEFAGYLEGLLEPALQSEVESHLANCAACATEMDEVRTLVAQLTRETANLPRISIETAVQDRILHEQTLELRRLRMRRRIRLLGISGAMATAIALFFIGNLWLTQPAAAEKAAAEVLAQGAEAVPKPSAVHIAAKMRTIAHDNFSMIGADYDFVPVEIWKEFGDKPKWRVEKPGRVAVVDGASTMMLIRPDHVVKFPGASRAAFDTGWLLALADVQDMITHELRAAQARGWDLKLTHETTGAGAKKLLVTVEAKSGLPADDYLKNKFFEDSDMRRVYRFDAETKRLEGFDAYLRQPGGDVLILSIERIEYDQLIDPTVFTLKLPEKAKLYKEPERLSDNEKYEKMTPEQAAQAFFDACGREDWKEVEKFYSPIDENFKLGMGGVQVLHLGVPFQSKAYVGIEGKGWFIPYEIKFKSGTVRRFNLAMRSDNPANRYIVDGGLSCEQPLTRLPENEKYEKMTAGEAVRAFFDACTKKDWDEVQKFSVKPLDDRDKEYLGGIQQLIDVGEPFQKGLYPGWYVPYEIRIVVKQEVVARNDNPAKRYIVYMTPQSAPDAKQLADVKTLPDNEKYESMTPKEAVQAFFDACVKKDWVEAQKFVRASEPIETLQKEMESPRITDVHVGEVSQTKEPGCWDVSVEISVTKKFNLAIRNDNSAKRWVWDGGL